MLKSLRDTVCEPSGTQSAIRQALKSAAGLRIAWVVVEAEEDVAVYEKFMQRDSTVVKTSEDNTGHKGYANLEIIVQTIKEDEPRAHIMGIRDADYSRYEEGYSVPVNIFLTDRRDLEMMLLETESVKKALEDSIPEFEQVWNKCVPICRLFGYMRICNDLLGLDVRFRNILKTGLFWDYGKHSLMEKWEERCMDALASHTKEQYTPDQIRSFISGKDLAKESSYDICRGHDVLRLMSLTLVQEHLYSEEKIMAKMTAAYSLEDFKATKLYANIQVWQAAEGVVALVA